MPLLRTVTAFFDEAGLCGTPGIVAVSGGPDSVALAHLLTQLLREGFFPTLVLAHVNHGLRGAASDADEAFVAGLPDAWRVPGLAACTTRIDVAALARERRDNLEKVAREVRYEWLAGVARERRAAWVATGHSADDQAETVLHRLLRGAGLQGLAAILPRRPVAAGVELVRPLLTVRRGAILAYLQEQGQASCHDSSNDDRRFTRNRIRLDLLPLLTTQYQPAFVDVLCRLAEEARAVHRDVRAQAGQMLREAELPRAGDLLVFDLQRLESMPPHLVREMFRLVWQREGWPMSDMNRRAWHVVVELALGRRTGHDFPGRVRARRRPPVLQVGRSSR